jgi:hypothetical protein
MTARPENPRRRSVFAPHTICCADQTLRIRTMRAKTTRRLGLVALLGLSAAPALAQSTGYVTGFSGKDPAGDEAIGWGPAYRPETSFAQPGTPPTQGEIAGRAYRARTGHGVYDRVEGNDPYRAR